MMTRTHPASSQGFSLVEILVGMAVALLATLVISQMYANFEGQKRTSTTGADAQENGLIAMHTVERDARMAGVGLASSAIMNCTQVYSGYDQGGGSVTVPAPGFSTTAIAPVSITDGGSGPDAIVFTFGQSFRSGVPTAIRQAMPSPSGDLKVTNTVGFTVGQIVMVTNGSQCTIMQITNIQSPGGGSGLYGLVHNNGVNAPYNPSGNITNSWPAYGIGSAVYSLDGMTIRRYSIGASGNTSSLRVEELSTPTPAAAPLVGDIIDLQAQYGIAPTGSQQVNCWVNATNGGNACDGNDWQNPTPTNIKRIKAVRIAMLARSSLAEKPSVAGGACDTTTVAPSTWSGGPGFNLTGNWQCYRYKVFQTVVPLRNIVWANL